MNAEEAVGHSRSCSTCYFDRRFKFRGVVQMNGMESSSDNIHMLRTQALLLSKGEEIQNVSRSFKFRIFGKKGQGG